MKPQPVLSWRRIPEGYAAEIDCGHAWELHGAVRSLPVEVECGVCKAAEAAAAKELAQPENGQG
jgi:hypothetical protein